MVREFIKKTDKKAVLAVDSLNLGFRYLHSGQKKFAAEYIATVKSLAVSYGCGKIIMLADKGASEYRLNIDPEYKANRRALRETQTEAEKQKFSDFITEFEQTILELEELEGIPVLRYQGIEADDLAGYITKHRGYLGISKIKLISSDKDWSLLINENVSQFSTVTRKEYSIDTWSDHYSFSPEQFLSFKCLTGDKGDNIPGIPQIGPKRAEALLEEYDDIFNIYDAIPIDSKYKFIQNLNANKEQLMLNVELMSLLDYCDDIIGENAEDLTSRVMRYMQS